MQHRVLLLTLGRRDPRWRVPVLNLLSIPELLELSVEPCVADRDDEPTCLAVDLRKAVPAGDWHEALLSWLGRQPVPVVALAGQDAGTPLAAMVDVVVTEPDQLERVLACIAANPEASAVLVQVLRAQATLDIPAALALESLGYATLQAGHEFRHWLTTVAGRYPVRPETGRAPVRLRRDGTTLHVTLDSVHNRNALSRAMRDALTDAFRLVLMDPDIEEVRVDAEGPCFSAGGDLSEFGSIQDQSLAHAIRMRRMPARYLAACAGRCRFRLHGAAIGAGIELSAFAGHVVASPDTVFRLPEIAMGLIPGAGGCVSIPRRIGRQRTALMAILGTDVDARTALAWGLIDAIEND